MNTDYSITLLAGMYVLDQLPVDVIADRLGIDKYAVVRQLRQLGIIIPRQKRSYTHKPPYSIVGLINAYLVEGLTLREIGERFNISGEMVRLRLNENGITTKHRLKKKACANPECTNTYSYSISPKGQMCYPKYCSDACRKHAAILRRATHCKQGHLMEGENVILYENGTRRCRECQRIRIREYNRRKAQERKKQHDS